MVSRNLEHSFKAIGLGLGDRETEIKVKYFALAQFTTPTNMILLEQE
jgi:hypothetical protein